MKNNETPLIIRKCPHCSGKGTCLADNRHSCGTCIKENKLKKKFNITICSVCGGVGMVEPKTQRLQKRLPFMIVSIVLIVFYAYAMINLFKNDHFDVIFPVIGSLTTMIVTFYFTQKNNN